MSVMNTDFLSRLAAIDPTYAESAASQASNSQAAFGNYLQMAQAQPADAAANSGSWSSLGSSETMGLQTTNTYATPQLDTSAATNQSAPSSADLGPRKTGDDSSSRQPDATSAANSSQDSSPSAATSQDAATTSQDNRKAGSQDSGSGASNQVASQPSGDAQGRDTHKAKKGDSTAAIADLNMVATAAANGATIAVVNPANDAQAKAAPADTKPGNAVTTPTAANLPQTTPATPADGQSAVAEQAAADPPFPAPKEKPASTTAATVGDPSAAATPVKPDDKTLVADPVAAAAAVTPTNPAAGTAIPSTGLQPQQSAAVSGAHAASEGQTADTAPVNDAATAIPDAQAAPDQRAKSAVDSLLQTNHDTNTTPTKSENPASSPTAAVPQTATHNASAAAGDTSTAQTADANSSQADRVRFVQRVEQAFQDLSDQGGSVRLRLSPPELGSLHIEISVAKGEMTARVQAETPAARNILLDNLPALRERLAQHDIKVQRFDVDLMDRSAGGMSNQSSQYQNPSQQNPGGAAVRTPFRGSSALPGVVDAATSRPVSEGGRLNVIV